MKLISGTMISAVLMSIVLFFVSSAEGRKRQAGSFQTARSNPAEMQRPDIVIPRLEKKIHGLIMQSERRKGFLLSNGTRS